MSDKAARLRESIKANVNVFWRAHANGYTSRMERARRKIAELKKQLKEIGAGHGRES